MKKSVFVALALFLASLLCAEELVFDKALWQCIVREGAEGKAEIAEGKLTLAKTNDKGEVLAFLRSHSAKPNTWYRFTVVVVGEPGGGFHLLNPTATKRTWPNSGPFHTNGRRQTFKVDMKTVDGEESFGTQLRLLSQGTYVFESFDVEELTEEKKQAELFAPLPENLLECDWQPRYSGPVIAYIDIKPELLTVDLRNTDGTGGVTCLRKIGLKKGVKYRVTAGVRGPNDGNLDICLDIGGAKPRGVGSGLQGTNGRLVQHQYEFTPEEGDESAMIALRAYKPGVYRIQSVHFEEVDAKKEFAEMQKRFRLLHMMRFDEGDLPEEIDPVFSENLSWQEVGDKREFSGKLALLLKKALPDHAFRVQSPQLPKDVRAEIVVRDADRKEFLRTDMRKLPQDGFLVPSTGAFVYLELTSPKGIFCPAEKIEIRENGLNLGAFRWLWWNSYAVGNTENVPTLYRRKFSLKKQPIHATVRLLTAGTLSVNGQDFGPGFPKGEERYPDTDQYYKNVLSALRIGENEMLVDIAAANAQNMQVDILLSFADGTHQVILSDDGEWEMLPKGATEWQPVPVLLATFKKDEFGMRWIAPGEMPDDFITPVNYQGKASFGETVLKQCARLPMKLTLDFAEPLFLASNKLDCYITDESGEHCWKQALFTENPQDFVLGKKGKITYETKLCTEFLKAGRYHLELPCYGKGRIEGEFEVKQACKPRTDFEIVFNENHSPMFKRDGKLYPASLYYHNSRFLIGEQNYFLQDFCHSISEKGGVHVHVAVGACGPDRFKNSDVRIDSLWTGPGEYHFDKLDRVVENFLSADSDGMIVLNINLDCPKWWMDLHPDELAVWDNGEKANGVSWASELWNRDLDEAMRKLGRHYAEKPHSSRIVGFYCTGGYDGQWWQYLSWGKYPYQLTDYSSAMLRYFRAWLRKKYVTDETLQKVWCNDNVTLDTAEIPTREERIGTTFYRDPQKGDWKVMDYIYAQADMLKDHLLGIFASVKRYNPNIVTGSYYIPNWDCSYIMGQAQRQLTTSMFDEPLYQFAAAPMEYLYRTPDRIGNPVFGRRQYFALNRKLWVIEDDNRSFMFHQMPIAMWGNHNAPDCVNTLRRNYAQRLALGTGRWFYDMWGSWFDSPVMERLVREEQLLINASTGYDDLDELNAQVVNVRDINVTTHNRLTNGSDLGQVHYWRREEDYTYPVDEVMMRDLDHPQLPKYKLYYIGDLTYLDAEGRARIEALKTDGNILVFQHAVGYSNGENISAENISALTSIQIVESRPGEDASDMSWNYADGNDPLLQGLAAGGEAMKGFKAKRFAVQDADAVPLGHYIDGGEVAAAVKRHENWTAVYLPTTLPPFPLMRNLVRAAGVHVYTDAPATLRSGGRFITVYCQNEEAKGTLELPVEFALFEVMTQQELAPVKSVEYNLRRGDSRLWFVGTPEEVHRFATEVKANWK